MKAGKALAKKPDPKDPERPPWRSVANVTPIKVNKNALLKAKILDATRRALLAQRICHMATQTDPIFTTVLLREKQTDIQKDLIGLEDKAMETDGAVMIRQEYPGGCKKQTTTRHRLFDCQNKLSSSFNYTNYWANDRSHIQQRNGYTNSTTKNQFVVFIAE